MTSREEFIRTTTSTFIITILQFKSKYINNFNNRSNYKEQAKMITLYELKTKGSCRCFMRTPFYIKNFILLCILSFMMVVIYFVYFRKDGMAFSNIGKILKGLNSQTFNYLENNSESLRLTRLLNNFQAQIYSN